MIEPKHSRNLAAVPRPGCFPACRGVASARSRTLFLLACLLVMAMDARADNPPTFLFQIDSSAVPGGFSPNAIALDTSNNLYVADYANNRILIGVAYGTSWDQLAYLGTNYGPDGIAVDGSNNVYVAGIPIYSTTASSLIQKFDSRGNILAQWGAEGDGLGQFEDPNGIAVDSGNNVYVVDEAWGGGPGPSRIEKFNSSGTYLNQWTTSVYPYCIAVDGSNNVYVTGANSGGDQTIRVVQKFNSIGHYLTEWGSYGTNNGQFNWALGVAVDRSNNVYVTDVNNTRIQKFDSQGRYLTQWGSPGSGPGQFGGPAGVAVDNTGNYIYVGDGDRIEVFANNTNIVPPVITQQPTNQTVPAGVNVTFNASAIGTAPLAYQWTSNNVAVPGATNATFTLIHAGLSDSATYSVLVTNSFGSELSSSAVLAVYPNLLTTLPASGLSVAGAVLNGSVTVGPDETVVWFDWGTDTNYGNIAEAAIVPGDDETNSVSATLNGLSGNIYHYRLVAANDFGIIYGDDEQFAVAQTVLNTNDNGPGSLRQAIETPFPVSVILGVTGTITLTNGELLITNDLTLIGPGAANLVISGNHSNRVFEIGPNATVSLSGLTIRDGHAADGYGNDYYGANGGGIYNQGTITLSGCALTNNSAGRGSTAPLGGPGGGGGAGGGIYNANILQATDCAFSGNQAGSGGAGGNGADEDVDGGAGGAGGGIYNANIFQATACTFSGNQSGLGGAGGIGFRTGGFGSEYGGSGGVGGSGGGLYNLGTMTLTNCTLGANQCGSGGVGGEGNYGNGGFGGDGGGIYNSGSFSLVACTLSANSAAPGGIGGDGNPGGIDGSGGGIFNAATNSTAELLDTLVALNNFGSGGIIDGDGPDLSGPFTSLGFNLIGQTNDSAGFTNRLNADLAGTATEPLDPQLGPLASNGGPTLTMALLHGSPALAAGDDALLGPPYDLATDQRGFPRIAGAQVDIGALQFQPIATPPALITLSGSPSGGFQLVFANTSTATFSVLSASNLALPFSNWDLIGQPLEFAPGQFQFTDPQTTNDPQRFYRVSSP